LVLSKLEIKTKKLVLSKLAIKTKKLVLSKLAIKTKKLVLSKLAIKKILLNCFGKKNVNYSKQLPKLLYNYWTQYDNQPMSQICTRGCHGRYHMVDGFTTTYAISAYHHWCCEFESRSRARYTTLCDKVCQWLATGRWFLPGTPVSSTNKIACFDILVTEILLKVALNTINQNKLDMYDIGIF
jgi:hypothetical protein